MPDPVYLDYSATTPVDARVVEAMEPFWSGTFGNPNSLYSQGRSAFAALEDARTDLAALIGAQDPREIMFTGCGTESDNAAILGIARASQGGKHVVVSAFEHHAVLAPAEQLAAEGYDVTHVQPRSDGVVYPEDLTACVREDTVLVSVMHVNNELGTVQPISDLASVAHEVGAAFHTDAVQSVGKIPFDAQAMGVDAASMSAHKIYGPKGVGALYLRRGTPYEAHLRGGGQEAKRRSGTQNVGGAVAITRALELMVGEREQEAARLMGLRDRLIERVRAEVEGVALNGEDAERLPGVANFLFEGVEGESMLLHLDNDGFSVATGSACSSKSLEPSHVLMAIGCRPELAHGSLRVSMGRFTTEDEVESFCDALPPIVAKLRAMSPVYKKTRDSA